MHGALVVNLWVLTKYRLSPSHCWSAQIYRLSSNIKDHQSSQEGSRGHCRVIYFLTGCRISSTLPMSPSLASSRLASQPPSLEKPMFIMACKATWIRGSGWTAVAGGAEAPAAAVPWSGVEVSVVVTSVVGRVG